MWGFESRVCSIEYEGYVIAKKRQKNTAEVETWMNKKPRLHLYDIEKELSVTQLKLLILEAT